MCTLERIIQLIDEKGITKKQFLKDIGLNSTALSDWQKGTNTSYKKHIDVIADYFNTSVDYLLGRDNMAFSSPEKLVKIIDCYNSLSDAGKEKAVEYLQMLKQFESQGNKQ